MLHDKQVDAVMGEARSLLQAYDEVRPPLSGLKFGGTFGDGTVRLQMAVRSDWPELVTVLNRSLDALPPEQLAQLRCQWLGAVPPQAGAGEPAGQCRQVHAGRRRHAARPRWAWGRA